MSVTDTKPKSENKSERSAQIHPRIAQRYTSVTKRRERFHKFRIYFVVGILSAILLGVGILFSPLFYVKTITVVGASLHPREHYIALAEIADNTSVVGLDRAAIIERIETEPVVQAATAKSHWNGEVVITVHEHVAVGRFVSYGKSIVTSSDGTVLDVGEDIYSHLPVIHGAMFNATVGDSVPQETLEAISLAAALPSDITKLQQEVTIRRDSLELKLLGGATVSFGDTREVDRKFDALRSVVTQISTRCIRNINLTAPAAPVIIERPGC